MLIHLLIIRLCFCLACTVIQALNGAQGERERSDTRPGAGTDATTSGGNRDVGPPPPGGDHVVDHLYDTEDALRNCYLVSKSWTPRTRKHLFANIWFPTAERLQSRRESSQILQPLLRVTLTLCSSITFGPSRLRTRKRVAGSEFFRVSCAWRGHEVEPDFGESATTFVPFHGFSLAIKSLCVAAPALSPSQIFDLIASSPLLEDLAMIICSGTSADDCSGSEDNEIQMSPPRFTGSLELY